LTFVRTLLPAELSAEVEAFLENTPVSWADEERCTPGSILLGRFPERADAVLSEFLLVQALEEIRLSSAGPVSLSDRIVFCINR
jgi:hypothetical protein